MAKEEMSEELLIANICNEATDCILKKIHAEDRNIKALRADIDRLEEDYKRIGSKDDQESQKLLKRLVHFRYLLTVSQNSREKFTFLLRPKIDDKEQLIKLCKCFAAAYREEKNKCHKNSQEQEDADIKSVFGVDKIRRITFDQMIDELANGK
jgi:hypothetical protein